MTFHTQRLWTNTAHATQNDTLTISYACHAICTLSPRHPALTMRFAKNTQKHASKVLHLPHKIMMEVSKVLRLPREFNSSSENRATASRLSHKTTFDTFADTSKCHEVPRLPRKTTLESVWKPSNMKGFAASPIDTATPQEHQSMKTRHVGSLKRAFHETSSNQLQNRRFPSSFS